MSTYNNEEWDKHILEYGLFDGDFGDSTDRELSNKMVIGRKSYPFCHVCGGTIGKGERHRHCVMKWSDEKEVRSYRVCSECCEAIARDVEFWSSEEAGILEAPEYVTQRFKLADERHEAKEKGHAP